MAPAACADAARSEIIIALNQNLASAPKHDAGLRILKGVVADNVIGRLL